MYYIRVSLTQVPVCCFTGEIIKDFSPDTSISSIRHLKLKQKQK